MIVVLVAILVWILVSTVGGKLVAKPMAPRLIELVPSESVEPVAIPLAEVIASINGQIEQNSWIKSADPVTERDVVTGARKFRDSEELSERQDELVGQLIDHRVVAEGLSVRHFVRYDDGDSMKHGSWIRVLVDDGERTDGFRVRDIVVVDRPYTQKERQFRASIKQGGMPTLGRLVAWFEKDPKSGQSITEKHDFQDLLDAIEQGRAAQSIEPIVERFCFDGVGDDDSIREFIDAEIDTIVTRNVKSISALVEDAVVVIPTLHEGLTSYVPNLSVVGYVQIEFDDQQTTLPRRLALEVGHLDGATKFVSYIVQDDGVAGTKQLKLSQPVSVAEVNLPVAGGFESISTIEAPAELPGLIQANGEIWYHRVD